ncbi:MAG: class II fructose-bisphosphate aldolase, partial [Albidovulum sp.]|nr:class II fructose-bisphosphate aldolase [Albidovulum sp.]
REAIECGFSSVMFDGSRNAISENIDQTAVVAEMAHAYDVSCEGEIGFVGYDGGEDSARTDPEEAARFARETKVDALAVSVGNVHLQQRKAAKIDFDAVRAIESATSVPLVIHGGSGIDASTRRKLARTTAVSKFNIGTELRMVFGNSLRAAVNLDGERFDRIQLLSETEKPVEVAAREIIRSFGPGG